METFIRDWATKTARKAEREGRGLSEYVTYKDLTAYVRMTKRMRDGEWILTMEIANVEVVEQNQGTFTKWLASWERVAHELERVVRIESVHNPYLRASLIKKGYVPDPNDPDSFYEDYNIRA
jgi:hypothetical protein